MCENIFGKKKAATTVEFILVIPFILMIIFSSLEFSFMMVERHLLNSALYSSAKMVTRELQNISLGSNSESGFVVLKKDNQFYKITVNPEEGGEKVRYDFGSLVIPPAPSKPSSGDSPIPSTGPHVEDPDESIHQPRDDADDEDEGEIISTRASYALERFRSCSSNEGQCLIAKGKCKFALAMYGGILDHSVFSRYASAGSAGLTVSNLDGLYHALRSKLSPSSCRNTDTAVQRDIDAKRRSMEQALTALNHAKAIRDQRVQEATQLEAAVRSASEEDREAAQQQAQTARTAANQAETNVQAAQVDYTNKQAAYNSAKTNFNRYKYLPQIKEALVSQGFPYTQSYPNEFEYCQRPLQTLNELYQCAK